MSIVPLDRITIIGPLAEKMQVLRALQALGCMHIEPENAARQESIAGLSTQTKRAYRFLATAKGRRHQAHHPGDFDAQALEGRALAIQERLRALAEERRFLLRRIRDLSAWGDFRLPEPQDRLDLRFWFYIVPRYRLDRMPRGDVPWHVVGQDNRFAFVVVLSVDEPRGIPFERTHTGSVPLASLLNRFESIEIEHDDLQAERVAMSRWLDLFAANIAHLEDDAALRIAAAKTCEVGDLFVISGWTPSAHVERVCILTNRACCALLVEAPGLQDEPPTLLANTALATSGQDLLAIYTTPGYWTWDPSLVVVCSFTLFFGMILGDAGYGLVLFGIAGLFWRSLGGTPGRIRFRALLLAVAASTVAIGMASGSYFGLPPAPGSLLSFVRLFDSSQTVPMMEVAAAVGVLHLALGNFIAACRQRGRLRFAPIGWAVLLLSGAALYAGYTRSVPALSWLAYGGLALAVVTIFLSSGTGTTLLGRAAEGSLALGRVSSAFGDVLSHLRLFALGFAGTSLAAAFNNLGADSFDQLPALGMLPGVVILVLGHGLNFMLGVAGGFVHGLRLIFIEFFNWSMAGEGRPFQAFCKREVASSLR